MDKEGYRDQSNSCSGHITSGQKATVMKGGTGENNRSNELHNASKDLKEIKLQLGVVYKVILTHIEGHLRQKGHSQGGHCSSNQNSNKPTAFEKLRGGGV